jgi:hypothetical protein
VLGVLFWLIIRALDVERKIESGLGKLSLEARYAFTARSL